MAVSVESNSLNKCLDPLNACVKDKFLPQRSSKIPGYVLHFQLCSSVLEMQWSNTSHYIKN